MEFPENDLDYFDLPWLFGSPEEAEDAIKEWQGAKIHDRDERGEDDEGR